MPQGLMNGDKARWFEVGVSILASVGTTAAVVSWTLSAALSSIREKVEEHEKLIAGMGTVIAGQASTIASLSAHQDDADRFRSEQNDRLKSIEEKLDKLLYRTKQ